MTVRLEPDPVVGFVTLDNRGSRLTGPWLHIAGATSYGVLGLNEQIDYPYPNLSTTGGRHILGQRRA